MARPPRTAKYVLVPALLAVTLFVAAQAVLADPPVTGFDLPPGPVLCNEPATFTSTASDVDGDPLTIEWDYDYGGPGTFDGTDQTGTHTFTTPGSKSVGQRVTAGLDPPVESAAQTLTVQPNADPTPAIDGPDGPVQPGASVGFTGSATGPGGPITDWAWDFDYDGATFNVDSDAQSPSHPFTTSSLVALRATDTCGGQAIATAQVTVANGNPTASFTMTANGTPVTVVNPGTPVDFVATASDPNGDPLTFAWDLDGNPQTDFTDGNTAQVLDRVYAPFPTAKTVTARLRVTDGNGGQVIVEHPLVINKAPFATFTVTPTLPLVNTPVTFDARSSFDFEPDGGIESYQWDFEYGGTEASFEAQGSESVATHSFATPGKRLVALRVTDVDGGVTTFPREVDVQVTAPNAGLTYSPRDPVPGQAVTLTSTSQPSTATGPRAIEATQWDFAYDPAIGFTSDGQGSSVITSFATPGRHTVAILVTETGGGSAIKQETVDVNAPPQASFTVSPKKPVEGSEVTFVSTAGDPDGPLVKQEWDLDGDSRYEGTGAVVSTSKLKKGSRTVGLRVTDSRGATAVSSLPVTVKAKPLRPAVDVKRSIGFARRAWGIELITLIVKVPSKTTVKVTCKGRGCHRGTLTKRTKKKGAKLRFDGLKGSVRAGAKITLLTTRPGHISAFDTYRVRGKYRAPLLVERCKRPGAKAAQTCS
jgi:hypothetical protein